MGGIEGITLAEETNPEPPRPPSPKPEGKEFTLENVASKIKLGKIKKVAVLTGAGISTSAGIPDFRSPDSGLYSQMKSFHLPYPEAVFSMDYFLTNPEVFYTVAKGMMGKYVPTKAHYLIRLLQDKGILLKNYTQNVDNLEADAGVKPTNVMQAHGSVATARCAMCKTEVDQKLMMEHLEKGIVLRCAKCNGPCKPDVVLFGEALPLTFASCLQEVTTCDLAIVMGTSLKVQPFAALVELVKSNVPIMVFDVKVPAAIEKDHGLIPMIGQIEEMTEKFVKLIGMEAEYSKLMLERENIKKKYAELVKKA